ncbi:hypothetical protein SAMN05444392_1236 [Seinonella peptonophila]|uniref:EthD domain-containing protein n=1 Tax=Seinonella peptonophila TaxID=112248 RepID=A0A1M5BFM4_9BACL|nr:hypothetical protein [Seinonella peptonophila]SHF41238.1 hypothetical protein SAMN05444392_1236 [Seinonella peptonophila]
MIKSIDIFRKITDLPTFKKIFSEEVCPSILKIPGVTQLKLTSVTPLSTDLSQDVEGIELILEIYLESEEALHQIISSPEAQEAMALAAKLPGELSLFLGREETLTLK